MILKFTILGPPRTKKTSNRLIRVGGFHKVLPSKAYCDWLKTALQWGPMIRHAARKAHFDVPLQGRVAIRATFFRDANRGDLTGYEQALADALQEPLYRGMKQIREGIGIIQDDRQIVHWDGTRLAVDRENPRVEVEVILLEDTDHG